MNLEKVVAKIEIDRVIKKTEIKIDKKNTFKKNLINFIVIILTQLQ